LETKKSRRMNEIEKIERSKWVFYVLDKSWFLGFRKKKGAVFNAVYGVISGGEKIVKVWAYLDNLEIPEIKTREEFEKMRNEIERNAVLW